MIKALLVQLRHRRVLRTAVAYAIVAAAVVEFTDIVTPALALPESLIRGVIITSLVGFPLVMVFSWFYDWTSDGVVPGAADKKPASNPRTHFISIMLIGVLAIAVAYLSYRLYWVSQESPDFERGKSIAVLPFSSISADAEPADSYFSDGVADEILSALSKVQGLRVAARTSSFAFREYDIREVGEALNVSVVLEGTVRRSGDQLRIAAQLVDTASGFQLWSDVYNHQFEDVFDIQEQIAHAIVKALRLQLLGDRLVTPGTGSSQAYDKYLEGRNILQKRTPDSALEAKALFEQAIAFDSDYAQAYAGLADSWILLREVGNLTLSEATLQSHTAITKALQLNSALPEAQASLGLCILGGGEKSLAGSQFQKAIALDPEYTDGYILHANLLRDQGYLNEATRLYTQALALDPLNPSIHENQALLAAYQGNHEQALEQLEVTAQANPGRLTGHLAASRVSVMAGNYSEALNHALAATELAPQSPIALAALLESHLRLGNQSDARSTLARMLESAPNNETAIIATMRFYLMTGDYQALDSLANARVSRFIDNPAGIGSEFLFEHVTWAATARLASGDASGAHELMKKGILNPDSVDPNPAAANTLALWARALSLGGDRAGAEQMATEATQLIERAREQGWGGSQMDYALASAAASTGATDRAMKYLRKANEGGWSDFVYTRHDPVMTDVVNSSGYKELAGDRLKAD